MNGSLSRQAPASSVDRVRAYPRGRPRIDLYYVFSRPVGGQDFQQSSPPGEALQAHLKQASDWCAADPDDLLAFAGVLQAPRLLQHLLLSRRLRLVTDSSSNTLPRPRLKMRRIKMRPHKAMQDRYVCEMGCRALGTCRDSESSHYGLPAHARMRVREDRERMRGVRGSARGSARGGMLLTHQCTTTCHNYYEPAMLCF
ncbi:hypothetical protein BC628DRAFT_1376822 [Trametes gibbosa]|nr:hypothetical protein BC628DRAFT_1376822 [Trametes gibbosa]